MAELLKEAIADAKAVREVALQNAKMALEEAFDSKLKSMLSAKLAEEIEEDVELEEVYEEDDDTTSEGYYEEDDTTVDEEVDLEEDFDLEEEEINLDELMAELESLDEGDDEEALEERKRRAKKDDEEDDDTVDEGKSEDDDELKEDFDIDALISEIEAELEEEALEERKRRAKKDDDEEEETVDEAYGDSPGKGTGPAKGKPGSPFGDGKSGKGGTGYDAATKQLKEERDEALAAVATLQETISEMNLLNSKLLYCNKLFRANALTEAQKVKVVDALDKATTTGEAKLVFETLQESFNFTGVEKKAIKEGLGRASKPAGVAPKNVITESVDETVSRFQKLANIKL